MATLRAPVDVAETEVTQLDLAAFKKEKERIVQYANTEVANKIQQVKALLSEIQEIADVAGLELDIDDIGFQLADMSEDYTWTSSSY